MKVKTHLVENWPKLVKVKTHLVISQNFGTKGGGGISTPWYRSGSGFFQRKDARALFENLFREDNHGLLVSVFLFLIPEGF